MPFAAACSKSPDLETAIREVAASIRGPLGSATADLTFVFVNHAHADGFERLPRRLLEALPSRTLLGCTGETVIGGHEEIERGPALAVWQAAGLGEVVPFHVRFEATSDGVVSTGLPLAGAEPVARARAAFLLGDPYSTAPQSVVQWLADEQPGVPLLGGMASGGAGPGTNRVFFGDRCLEEGAVGALLFGGPRIRTVVSQGCKPIGTPFVVTAAERNIVLGLGGKPPLVRLQEVHEGLTEGERQLVRRGLHLGLAMNEYQDRFERGDFLISNVIDANPDSGAIAIGNRVRVGQTVQFHVRDADTADEDLKLLLAASVEERGAAAAAALLFSCNGRGTRLFPRPNHDASAIQTALGPLPLAGFFAQGELGPVGDRNYMHGFTASVALFD